jgi:hypothetical protein
LLIDLFGFFAIAAMVYDVASGRLNLEASV